MTRTGGQLMVGLLLFIAPGVEHPAALEPALQPQLAMAWVQIAILVVSLVVSYAMRPKPTTPKPPAFEDIDIPQSAEGTAQAMDFGTVWSPDWMVLGVANYRTEAIRRKVPKK